MNSQSKIINSDWEDGEEFLSKKLNEETTIEQNYYKGREHLFTKKHLSAKEQEVFINRTHYSEEPLDKEYYKGREHLIIKEHGQSYAGGDGFFSRNKKVLAISGVASVIFAAILGEMGVSILLMFVISIILMVNDWRYFPKGGASGGTSSSSRKKVFFGDDIYDPTVNSSLSTKVFNDDMFK
ncbi:hypothetical protein [Thiomicrorhabdus aquaedulcis]|uniref:hypothetical protein n=1 Tax=Thiomicrorhabdus aquaedulcis TaxID=2211106 RepID=UPI000FD6BAC7|nr:hypothetical protein [Thiomicrorhabdus aquaedulcis]